MVTHTHFVRGESGDNYEKKKKVEFVSSDDKFVFTTKSSVKSNDVPYETNFLGKSILTTTTSIALFSLSLLSYLIYRIRLERQIRIVVNPI